MTSQLCCMDTHDITLLEIIGSFIKVFQNKAEVPLFTVNQAAVSVRITLVHVYYP